MREIAGFFVVLLFAIGSADAAQSRGSFGGTSRSSSPSGGSRPSSSSSGSRPITPSSGSRSSFGGSSSSTPPSAVSPRSSFGGSSKSGVSTIQERSNLPTRVSPFPPVSVTPRSSFGGASSSPKPTSPPVIAHNPVTSVHDRNSLPTRNSPVIYSPPYTDRAAVERARNSGTLFNSKQQATDAFKQRYSTTYYNYFPTMPTIWPSYIPRRYYYSNTYHDVFYNPTTSTYGYYHDDAWRNYNTFDDSEQLESLMASHDYQYSTPVTSYSNPVVTQRSPISAWGTFAVVAVGLGLIVVVVTAAKLIL